MNLNKNTVDKLNVDKLNVDKLNVDKLNVDKLVKLCVELFRRQYNISIISIPISNYQQLNLLPQSEAHTDLPINWQLHTFGKPHIIKDNKDKYIGRIWTMNEGYYVPISAKPVKINDDFITQITKGKIKVEFNYSDSSKMIFLNFYKEIPLSDAELTPFVFEPSNCHAYSYYYKTSPTNTMSLHPRNKESFTSAMSLNTKNKESSTNTMSLHPRNKKSVTSAMSLNTKNKESSTNTMSQHPENIRQLVPKYKAPANDALYRIISRIFTTEICGWISPYGSNINFKTKMNSYNFKGKNSLPLRIRYI
jgi:hypothetical protein